MERAHPRGPVIVVALAPLLSACFVDPGLEQATSTAASTQDSAAEATTSGTLDPETTTSTTLDPETTASTTLDPETTASTTGDLEPVCGDGVVEGSEACDDGPANVAHGPGCRLTCTLPACGDGSLYLGPLGPPTTIASMLALNAVNNDGPRALALRTDGAAAAVWISTGARLQLAAADGALLGGVVVVPTTTADSFHDVVIGGDGGEHLAIVWEVLIAGNRDLRIRRMTGGVLEESDARAHPTSTGEQQAAGVTVSPDGVTYLSYLDKSSANAPAHLFFREIPPGPVADAPAPVQLSAHLSGDAGSGAIARAGGELAVAWRDPESDVIVYRKISGGVPSPSLHATTLRAGSGGPSTARRWSGLALTPEGDALVVGVSDGHLALQRFSAENQPTDLVLVSEQGAAHFPYFDLAVDAGGNLAIAWSECGTPGEDLSACDGAAPRIKLRWFFSDLTPVGPAQLIHQGTLVPSPVGVVMEPGGRTVLATRESASLVLRSAPVVCP